MRRFRIFGLVLLAVVVAIPWLRSRTLENTNWTPLDIPFPSQATDLGDSRFTIDSDGTYQVVLKIDRPGDEPTRTLAECLMGVGLE